MVCEPRGSSTLSTNSGLLQPGGEISVYGGSHGTFQPSAEYGGSDGNFTYYVTGDYKQDNLGIESPDGSSNPLHDHTTQGHAFAYLEDIIDSNNRASLIMGLSDDEFEIPNQRGLQPSLGLDVNGQTTYLSDNLNERQHELAEYAIASWQHSEGALDWQTSLSVRYTSLHFAPDWVGDLLVQRHRSGCVQERHGHRLANGWRVQVGRCAHRARRSLLSARQLARAIPLRRFCPPMPSGAQTSNVPLTVIENGTQVQQIQSVYLQDEWKPLTPLTINYGLRYDHYSAYSSGGQLSPRVNAVWEFPTDTTLHGGYSRYFTPPPFELVGAGTFTQFAGTTAVPPGSVTQGHRADRRARQLL